jgi:hypothetical protein
MIKLAEVVGVLVHRSLRAAEVKPPLLTLLERNVPVV